MRASTRICPNAAQSPGGAEKLRPLADACAAALGRDLTAANFTRVIDYPSRWETPSFTAFSLTTLSVPSLVFEVPYAATADGALFTRERYREVGRRLADVVMSRL